MRNSAIGLAALTLCACSQNTNAPSTPAGCARSATHEVTWTDASAPDVITARSDGPSCSQAAVNLVVRNAHGDALWAFASTYYALTAGEGEPPENAPAVTNEQMDAFLSGWASVTQMDSGDLPEWREGVATLTESAHTFAYSTPFDRETYEMLRTRNLPMICYAAAAESSQCLLIDPANHAPTLFVAYGP